MVCLAEVKSRTQSSRKGHKKIQGQSQAQPFRGQTLSRLKTGMLEAKDQGHKRKCSKKKNIFFEISKRKKKRKKKEKLSSKLFPKNYLQKKFFFQIKKKKKEKLGLPKKCLLVLELRSRGFFVQGSSIVGYWCRYALDQRYGPESNKCCCKLGFGTRATV